MLYNTQNTIPCVFENRLQKLVIFAAALLIYLSPAKGSTAKPANLPWARWHVAYDPNKLPTQFHVLNIFGQPRDISLNLVFQMIPIRFYLLTFYIQDTWYYSNVVWICTPYTNSSHFKSIAVPNNLTSAAKTLVTTYFLWRQTEACMLHNTTIPHGLGITEN